MIWCLTGCIRFNWIIVGFFILTKLLAYTIILEDISPSLTFVIQKHPNFKQFLPGKFQSCSGDMCALREPLGDIGRIEMYALLLLYAYTLISYVIQSLTTSSSWDLGQERVRL